MYILVVAKSPPFWGLLFQVLGPYLKRFLFHGHLKKSPCWIVTLLVTTQLLAFGVCDITI